MSGFWKDQEGNVSWKLKNLEETVSRRLMAHEQATGEGLTESEENTAGWKKKEAFALWWWEV